MRASERAAIFEQMRQDKDNENGNNRMQPMQKMR
jgi:hypothetical protein